VPIISIFRIKIINYFKYILEYSREVSLKYKNIAKGIYTNYLIYYILKDGHFQNASKMINL